MRLRYGILCCFAAALLLPCGCSSSLRTRPGVTVPPVATAAYTETPAADIRLTDINGNEVFLFDHLGTPVLLQFWTNDEISEEELSAMQRAYAARGEEIVFLLVCPTPFPDLLSEKGFSELLYFDPDGSAAAAYGIGSSCATIFIDADGFIATQSIGPLSEDALLFGLQLL